MGCDLTLGSVSSTGCDLTSEVAFFDDLSADCPMSQEVSSTEGASTVERAAFTEDWSDCGATPITCSMAAGDFAEGALVLGVGVSEVGGDLLPDGAVGVEVVAPDCCPSVGLGLVPDSATSSDKLSLLLGGANTSVGYDTLSDSDVSVLEWDGEASGEAAFSFSSAGSSLEAAGWCVTSDDFTCPRGLDRASG